MDLAAAVLLIFDVLERIFQQPGNPLKNLLERQAALRHSGRMRVHGAVGENAGECGWDGTSGLSAGGESGREIGDDG